MFNILALAEKAEANSSKLATADSNVLTSLGLDWGAFGFYLICFGITFFALYKFLFKPMSGVLQARQDQVVGNIELQKTLNENLVNLESQKASVRSTMDNLRIETLDNAKAEAKFLSGQITDQANDAAKVIISEANLEAANIKSNAKSEIEKEVLAMWQEIIKTNLSSLQVDKSAQEQVIENLLKAPIK